MYAYIIRRLLLIIPTLLGIMVINFAVVQVLPGGPVRVAVEAATRFGWDKWLSGERGASKKAAFVGMEGFGASAPAPTIYTEMGITAENVVEKVKALIA